MPHEITMPQLGMAQDSGVIVSWLKMPGDAVKADDILMEVETDKATMEVEVGFDGFLVELRAEAGAAIPVGDVIAVISDNLDDVKTTPTKSATPDTGDNNPVSEVVVAAAKTPVIEAPSLRDKLSGQIAPLVRDASLPAGRILASPKAKFQAHQRGIDLQTLARQGVPQPFHLADLDKYVPAETASLSGALPSLLAAEFDIAAFNNLAHWAGIESDGAIGNAAVWSAFAAGALRQVQPDLVAQSIVVEYSAIGNTTTVFQTLDADLCGLSEIGATDALVVPMLSIFDMTQMAISEYRPGGATVPVLVISGIDTATQKISLYFNESNLPLQSAAALLDALTRRANEPLRHLL